MMMIKMMKSERKREQQQRREIGHGTRGWHGDAAQLAHNNDMGRLDRR